MLFDRIFTKRHLKAFCQREEGAVTVDWVVLTAVVCGLAIGIWAIIQDSLFVNGGVAIATDITEASRRDF